MDFQGGMIVLIVFVSLFAIWLLFYFIPVGLWFSALVSGVRISLLQLVLMRWRKVPPSTIVSSMIESTKAGLTLNPNELEAHYLAGGNVTNVVHALVSAQKANIMLDFKMATAIDLAGRDVFEAVQMSVNPKVINTPPVAAVAKDGIQLIAKARVTVRANIKQLVGGAGEETVLARVGEGIVSSIGSAASHKIVLENPDSISRVVLERGSTPERPSKSSRSTSPTSTWARTSAPSCRWTRRRPTRTSPRRKPRSGVRWPWRSNRRTRPRRRTPAPR